MSVEVSVDGDSITLRVTDDGRMMEAAAALGHQGLRTMRERALALGGVVEVDLSASGSRVTAIVPVADPVRARRADLAAAGALGERLLGELRDDLDRLESTRAEAAKRADHVKSRLDALDAFAHLIEHPSTPSLVWRRLAQSWSKCFGGAVAVRTPDPMNSSLVLRAMWHESPGQRVGYSRWLPESRPLTTQSTVTTTVTTHRAAIASVSELAAGAVGTPGFSPPHSALALPLHLPGGGVGVIEKYRDLDPEPFSNEDLSLLRIAATLAAQFVARSTLPSPSPNHS